MTAPSEAFVDKILGQSIRKGWPDRVVWKTRPLAIEIKSGADELSDDQTMVRELLHTSGWRYFLIRVHEGKILIGEYRGDDRYQLVGYPAFAQLIGTFSCAGTEHVTTDARKRYYCKCGWREVYGHALSQRAPFDCPDCGKRLVGKLELGHAPEAVVDG